MPLARTPSRECSPNSARCAVPTCRPGVRWANTEVSFRPGQKQNGYNSAPFEALDLPIDKSTMDSAVLTRKFS